MKEKTKKTTQLNLMRKITNAFLNDSLEEVLDNSVVDFLFVSKINQYAHKKEQKVFIEDKFPAYSISLKRKIIKNIDAYAPLSISFNSFRLNYMESLINTNLMLDKDEPIEKYQDILWKKETARSEDFLWLFRQPQFDFGKKYSIIRFNYYLKNKESNLIEFLMFNFLKQDTSALKSIFSKNEKENDYIIFKNIFYFLSTSPLKDFISFDTLEKIKKEFPITKLNENQVKWLEKEILNIKVENNSTERKRFKI